MSATPDASASIGTLPALCAASACSGIAARIAQARDRGDVRQHAGLVVRVHQRHERRVRPQRLGDLRRIDRPVRPRPQPGDVEALALELAAGVEARPVLDARGHDVASRGRRRARGAEDREVDALGRARGEDDRLGRGIARAPRPRPARGRDARGRPPAGRMRGGRIRLQRRIVEARGHHGGDARIERRGRGMVEVDRPPCPSLIPRRQPALDRGQPAAQDADLAVVRPGAREEPAHARTELRRVAVVHEARGAHHALEVRIEGAPLVGGRRQRRHRPRRGPAPSSAMRTS